MLRILYKYIMVIILPLVVASCSFDASVKDLTATEEPKITIDTKASNSTEQDDISAITIPVSTAKSFYLYKWNRKGELSTAKSPSWSVSSTSAQISVRAGLQSVSFISNTAGVYTLTVSDSGLTKTVQVTVVNNMPNVSMSDVTVNENAASAVLTVSLSTSSTQSITVNWSTSNATASAGSDYTAGSGTLTFAAGETSKTVTVSLLSDTTDEDDETFNVNLAGATNATITDSAGVVTITDDDSPPALSIANLTVNENVGTATVTVSLSAASGKSVAFDWASANGTALAGSDYTASSGTAKTIAAGATSTTLSIPITNDTMDEADETLTVSISNAVNSTIATSSATVTITDNDSAPTISIANASATEASNIVFTISLSAASSQSITVDWATSDDTALAGTDYTTGSGTVTFAAGETSKTISVTSLTDTTDENDETFTVTLSNPTNASITTSTATGTITDDDAPPALSAADVTVNENTGTASVTVSLSAASAKTVSFDWATANNTAIAGSDFTSASGTGITIAAGSTSTTLSVTITNDTTDEADETFYVNISNATNATIADNSALVTITDNDSAPSISIADASVLEGNSLVFTVSLSVASGQNVTFDWATSDGTATVAGSDYTSSSGTAVTIAAGATSTTISVPTTGDSNIEANETLTVTLSNPVNASAGTMTATGTIQTDDLSFIHRSVGPGNTSPLASGSGNDLTISSVVASFASALPNNVGVGDAIQYDSNNDGSVDAIVFVSARTSSTAFSVRTASGATPSDLSAADQDWSAYRAYTSLSGAVNGSENSGINASLRNFDNWTGGRDLVANNEQWNITCYADADDTSVVGFSGASWVTSATNYMKIYAPNLTSQVGTSQRHQGVWSNSGYRLVTAVGVNVSLKHSVKYLYIEGLQISNSYTGGSAAAISDSFSGETVSGVSARYYNHNITRFVGSGAPSSIIGDSNNNTSNASLKTYIWNNIIYSTSNLGVGIEIRYVETVAYSNTIYNVDNGIVNYLSNTLLKNNLVQNSSSSAYSLVAGSWSSSSNYNLSDDTSTTGGANDVASATVSFLNTSSSNFLLSALDTQAKGVGANLSADSTLSFSTDVRGQTRSGTWDIGASNALSYSWTGLAGNNLWNDTANWGTGIVPGSSDVAIFDNSCSGANCNVTINQSISVKGLDMQSTYTGTVTQGAFTVTTGTSDFVMAGGTFVGSTSAITINQDYIQTGGTFTAGAQTITAKRNWTRSSAGTMTMTGSTVIFNGNNNRTIDVSSAYFDNLDLEIPDYLTLTITGTTKVSGTLTINVGPGAPSVIDAGTIEAEGNVVMQSNYAGSSTSTVRLTGTANQTITGTTGAQFVNLEINKTSGAVNLAGDIWVGSTFNYISAGSFNPGTSKLTTKAASTITLPAGGLNFYDMAFILDSISTSVSGKAIVARNLSIVCDGGTSGQLSNGTIEVQGNIDASITGSACMSRASPSTIIVNGSGAQTITGVANAVLPNLTINSTGSVSLSGTVEVGGNFTYTAGTFNAGTSTVKFGEGTAATISGGSAHFNDVTFNKRGTVDATVSGTLYVDGNLVLDQADNNSSPSQLNGGTVAVGGNITVQDAHFTGGTTEISMSGTSDQTVTQTAGTWPGKVIANKASGKVVQASALSFSTSGQDLELQNGSVWDQAGYNLTVTDQLIGSVGGGGSIYKRCATTTSYAGITGSVSVYDGTYGSALSIANASDVTEGSNISFTVSVSPQNCAATTFSYASSSGTSTSGTDFTSTSGSTNIPANTSSITLSVPTADDSAYELTENMTMTLSSVMSGVISGTLSGTGNILDNESAPSLTIADASVNENDGTVTVTVSLNRATYQDVTFDWTTANNTATAGSDYTAASGTTKTISAGSTSTTMTINITNDSLDEVDETFYVNISNASGGGATIADNSAVVTIVDEDAAPTISIAAASATEGSSVVFTVSLSAASGKSISFDWASSDGTATTANSDYTSSSGTGATISAGSTSTTVTVPTTTDTTD